MVFSIQKFSIQEPRVPKKSNPVCKNCFGFYQKRGKVGPMVEMTVFIQRSISANINQVFQCSRPYRRYVLSRKKEPHKFDSTDFHICTDNHYNIPDSKDMHRYRLHNHVSIGECNLGSRHNNRCNQLELRYNRLRRLLQHLLSDIADYNSS